MLLSSTLLLVSSDASCLFLCDLKERSLSVLHSKIYYMKEIKYIKEIWPVAIWMEAVQTRKQYWTVSNLLIDTGGWEEYKIEVDI